jgi:rhodanese-related sulfurtransferase
MLLKKYIVLITVLLVAFSLNADGHMQADYQDISAQEAKMMMEENPELIIIDVSPIWHKGHLPGAINYPWGDGSFAAATPEWDKEAQYLIYCHGDAPAIAAAKHLAENGFNYVYRLEGNYSAWVEAGYTVEK